VTGNRDLEDEGTADKMSGKAQSGVGDAKDKVKDAIDRSDALLWSGCRSKWRQLTEAATLATALPPLPADPLVLR
jgi:hypothetical protein